MAPSEKVGSWLSDTKATEEAYDSGSGSGSEAEGQAEGSNTNGNGRKINGSGPKVVREEVDWNDVLGRIRIAIGDKSPKRRQAFIARNLYVSNDCKSFDFDCRIVRRGD